MMGFSGYSHHLNVLTALRERGIRGYIASDLP